MKTINFWEITNPMSVSEMKGTLGGLDVIMIMPPDELGGGGADCNSAPSCGATPAQQFCEGKNIGDSCIANGKSGKCKCWPTGTSYCKICYT